MTPERLDEWLKWWTRKRMIPEQLAGIEKWVAEIRKAPGDIRNKPDERKRPDGEAYLAKTTDLQGILDHVAAVRTKFAAGDFELALNSLVSLRERVTEANRRLTARATRTGEKQLSALDENRPRASAAITAKHRPNWAVWQAMADKIWQKNSDLPVSAVAALIAGKTDAPIRTIRARIKKPGKTA
jgi:hypothetical protein